MSTESVIEEVAAERRRQRHVEDWTLEYDDQHSEGELAYAAACYTFAAGDQARGDEGLNNAPSIYWPWDAEWWKPRDARRNLVRAAALIVAEIERLDRAANIAPSQ